MARVFITNPKASKGRRYFNGRRPTRARRPLLYRYNNKEAYGQPETPKAKQGRIDNSSTPLRRSVRCTLPEIVDKDKRQRYQHQTVLSAKRIHPELQQWLKLLAKESEDPCRTNTTKAAFSIAPILATDAGEELDKDNNEAPEMLKTRVKAA
jgi:hypothetical protein